MYRRFFTSLAVTVILAEPALSQLVAAPQRDCAPPCPPDARCIAVPRCRSAQALVQRTSSRVRAALDGHVVRYEVAETYVNRGTTVGEVDYVLPLPKGAAFEDLALSINGEMVTGETMNSDRARAVYEEIVRKLRDPALVEWMGLGLLRTRIFPILPGEERHVVVRFRAVAEREGDALRVDWIGTSRAVDSGEDATFSLTYPDDSSLGEAYSPTHVLRKALENGRRLARADGARGPVTMLIPVRNRGGAAVSLLAHAPSAEDGYALITISPPARSVRAAPRDVVFVLDVSGSMSGRKIEQARAAGRQFLQGLTSVDRFRVIDFSSDVRSFREGWTSATGENLRAAVLYLEGLRANGGTNIQGALEEALQGSTPEGRLPLILFLTDGAPTVGETRTDVIARHAAELRRDRRLFTFGIGADVNAALIEQLALQGRGTATFVRPDESVERAVGIVAERLARPVATDMRLHADGVRFYGTQPEGTIDVFAGQDVVVLARYAGARENAMLTVEGHSPDGPVRWTSRVSLPVRSGENAFVARLWAVQRVGYLSAERHRGGDNTEIDAELRQLGERFGIPTELTSYLVKEPGMQVTDRNEPATRSAVGLSSAVAPGSRSQGLASGGADRFESAKLASEQRELKSVAELDKSTRRDGKDALRTAGSLTFELKDSVWTDTRGATGLRVVRVRAYSAAYFTLLQRIPELRPLFAVGERVRVNGRRVAIEVGAGGDTHLDASTLDALARDW